MDGYTEAQILEALEQAAGVVLGAALKLGCASSTLRDHLARTPSLRAAQRHMQLDVVDQARMRLINAMANGSLRCAEKLIDLEIKAAAARRGQSDQDFDSGGFDRRDRAEWLRHLSTEELSELEALVEAGQARVARSVN
jgi:hypothetical protein